MDFIPFSMVLSVVNAKFRLGMGAEKMLSNILKPLKGKYDARTNLCKVIKELVEYEG